MKKLFSALTCLIMGMSIPSLHAADKAATPKLPPFVKATGVGKDKEEALKNAFRESVRIAVGTVIDSEIIIKNDKVIKDEIIDYSRGFVERHKVLSEGRNSDGLYEVTIRATVKDRQLYEKLRRFQPASAKVEGSNIFGAVTSRMESRKKAAELLAKSLAATDLPLPLLKTEFLSKKPKILEENAESILAEWRVRVSFDQKLYQEKVYPWLRELLSDVATDKRYGQIHRNANAHRWGKLGGGEVANAMKTGLWPNPLGGQWGDYTSFKDSLPREWFAKDDVVYLLKNYESSKSKLSHTYDVFWIPLEVSKELAKISIAASKEVSELVFELRGEEKEVLLSKRLRFGSDPDGSPLKTTVRDFAPGSRQIPISSPNMFYEGTGKGTIISPVFQFFSSLPAGQYYQWIKDDIIVKWQVRVPLATINETKDVNCRFGP